MATPILSTTIKTANAPCTSKPPTQRGATSFVLQFPLTVGHQLETHDRRFIFF
ncbi:hypothetical protein VTH82DRAFT_3658 [Thermothelomyces myriococcoides]